MIRHLAGNRGNRGRPGGCCELLPRRPRPGSRRLPSPPTTPQSRSRASSTSASGAARPLPKPHTGTGQRSTESPRASPSSSKSMTFRQPLRPSKVVASSYSTGPKWNRGAKPRPAFRCRAAHFAASPKRPGLDESTHSGTPEVAQLAITLPPDQAIGQGVRLVQAHRLRRRLRRRPVGHVQPPCQRLRHDR